MIRLERVQTIRVEWPGFGAGAEQLRRVVAAQTDEQRFRAAC